MTTAICGMPARRQRRLVVEDAAEMLAIRKHLVLVGQIGAAGIDQIDAGQPVLARDLLRPQMLLHGDRKIGAALDGGVVGDDDAFLPHHLADAGDDAARRHVLAIDAMPGERRELEERRARIEQQPHALARQQLAAREVALARLRAAALGDARQQRLELANLGAQRRRIGRKGSVAGVDRCFDDRHCLLRRQAVVRNSSRPISMRRISLVPAPIS